MHTVLANSCITHADEWSRALRMWAECMTPAHAHVWRGTACTFRVRVVYTDVPVLTATEVQETHDSYAAMVTACRGSAHHLLPMTHPPIGRMTELCEEEHSVTSLKDVLTQAIHARYGWTKHDDASTELPCMEVRQCIAAVLLTPAKHAVYALRLSVLHASRLCCAPVCVFACVAC